MHGRGGELSSPQSRVRETLAAEAGWETAQHLPRGYQRLGSSILLQLPPELEPWGKRIGELYQKELGANLVLARRRIQKGSSREPTVEILAGEREIVRVFDGEISWEFDPTALMFSKGNMEERHRVMTLGAPGEVVMDLFAGIGYFSLPIAKSCHPQTVYAVEQNPVAYSFLVRNVRINHLEEIVHAVLGDNRKARLPPHSADRVLLGYLPCALPYLGRALELVREEGGWIHLHSVCSRHHYDRLRRGIEESVHRAGRQLDHLELRWVKSYGPSRDHLVADLHLKPV